MEKENAQSREPDQLKGHPHHQKNNSDVYFSLKPVYDSRRL
jgi:hypothetical protein